MPSIVTPRHDASSEQPIVLFRRGREVAVPLGPRHLRRDLFRYMRRSTYVIGLTIYAKALGYHW